MGDDSFPPKKVESPPSSASCEAPQLLTPSTWIPSLQPSPRSRPGPRVSAKPRAFCSTGSSVAIATREDHKNFTIRKSLAIRQLSRVSGVFLPRVSTEPPNLRTNATDRLSPATAVCAFIARHRRAPNPAGRRTAGTAVQTSWSDVWRGTKGNGKEDQSPRPLCMSSKHFGPEMLLAKRRFSFSSYAA